MLSKDTVLNALASAEQLKAAGKTFRALDNSPMQELVDASYPLANSAVQTEASTEPLKITGDSKNSYSLSSKEEFACSVNYTAENREDESMHSLRIRSMADNIAPFVTGHISFTRNTVIPLITETETSFNNFIGMVSVKSAESEFRITQGALPALLLDESFMAMGLENFKDGSGNVNNWINTQLNDTPVAIDELVSQITNLGNDRLNKLVQAWLEKAPYALIKRVYLTNFVKNADTLDNMDKHGRPLETPCSFSDEYNYNQYNTAAGRPYDSLNVALATYLIANWLSNNPQKTSGDISLSEYKNRMAESCISTGNAVNSLAKRILMQIETNILVSEYNAYKKEIVVHGAVYKGWLENGGCPEALLGFLVTNNPIFNTVTLTEKQDQGLRAWESYLTVHNTNSQKAISDSFVSFVRTHMYSTLQSLTDSEKSLGANEVVHRERVMKNVDEEIQHFSHRIMDDIPHLALHLVAKARFYFTSAYSILEEMINVEKQNPGIDPREAAGLAVISYIAEYLDGQVVLNNAK